MKYLFDGSLAYHNNILDSFTNFGFGFWDKGLFIHDNTMIHIIAKGYIGTLHSGSILKMDLSGNILIEKEFNSFYYPADDFGKLRDFERTGSGFIISDYGRKTDTDFQCCLIKTDHEFGQTWRKCYGNNSKEIPKDLLVRNSNKYLVIANSDNLPGGGYFTGSGTRYHRGYIFETDSLGNLNWEWRSASRMEAVYAGVLESDSILVVAAGKGREICSDSQSNAQCFFRWTGSAFKLNLNTGEKIWDTSLSAGTPTTMFNHRYLDIIPSIEKDGYILCGAGHEAVPGCAQIDTTVKCWSFPGIIAKVANNGDSLWMRKYFGIIDIYESNILYDVEITPDSGYSFVGEAFNVWPGETQGQFGWLLMTDKYGCLVPGCHLVTSVEDEDPALPFANAPIKIHPNPSSDIVNILITRTLKKNATLYLSDHLGRTLDSWHSFEKGATYMIPVRHLASGAYIFSLMEDNQIVYSHQIVKN